METRLNGSATVVARLFALACVIAGLGGCHPDQPLAPAPAAAVMLGAWSHAAAPPRAPRDTPSLNVGLLVRLTIDAADESSFYGTVAAWFAGDVGSPPGTFARISGTVDGGGSVTMVIPVQRAGTPPLVLAGRVVVDTLIVDASRQGAAPGPFATGAVFVRVGGHAGTESH